MRILVESLSTENAYVKSKGAAEKSENPSFAAAEVISARIHGKNILYCAARGDGKSTAFAIPCLVLFEYNNDPHTHHDIPLISSSYQRCNHTNKGTFQ